MLLISVNSVHHRIVSNTGQAEQAGRSTAVRLIAISSAHAEILSRTERRACELRSGVDLSVRELSQSEL
jgi:hypothetical protein